MGRKVVILLLGCVVIAGATVTIWTVYIKRDTPAVNINTQATQKLAEDSLTGLSLHYGEPLKLEVLSPQDQKDKFIFRMSSKEPAMLISVRYEDGLRTISSLAKQEPLELLLGNIDKAYPQRFPGYSLSNEHKLKVDGKSAAELIFTYKGPNGELAKQRQYIVMKDGDMAIIVSTQSKGNDFESLNNKYFTPLLMSLHFKK